MQTRKIVVAIALAWGFTQTNAAMSADNLPSPANNAAPSATAPSSKAGLIIWDPARNPGTQSGTQTAKPASGQGVTTMSAGSVRQQAAGKSSRTGAWPESSSPASRTGAWPESSSPGSRTGAWPESSTPGVRPVAPAGAAVNPGDVRGSTLPNGWKDGPARNGGFAP